jgi:hypothetical protein
MWVTIFMTAWTVYTLFGDDIKMLSTDASYDDGFSAITVIAMAFFLTEIGLSCIAKENYIFGFYFWLDLVSTLTMIMDIGWAWQAMIGGGSSSGASSAKKVSQMAR